MRRLLHSPKFALDLIRYGINDVASALRLYQYTEKVIFIASLPKSGGTWLQNMLLEIPGYNPRYYKLPPQSCDNQFVTDCYDHSNLPEDLFDNISGYSIYKTHCRCSEANLRLINSRTGKIIVGYRDLRDVCVSLYYHLKTDTDHYLYPQFSKLAPVEGISAAIKIVGREYVPWVMGWKEAWEEFPEQVCTVKYEDLWTNLREELERILAFYGISVSESFFQKNLRTKLDTPQDLKKSLADKTRLLRKNTARKGGVGGWADYFTDSHTDEFKKVGADLLISLGYEKDSHW